MINDIINNEKVGDISHRQKLFLRYTFFVLIDLTVINLFHEYWDLVFIESFSISLLVALLLQLLLQATIKIEHSVASYFKNKPGLKNKIYRGLSAWAILFSSKLIILKAISLLFGSSVVFGGPVHGVVAFIFVVIAIIVAEQIVLRAYSSLA